MNTYSKRGRYTLSRRNIFYILFFSLLVIYSFNKLSLIGENFKLFYLLLPFIYIYYFFQKKYVLHKEIKILLVFIVFQLISIINTFLYHPDVVGSVGFSTLREYIIIVALVPLYSYYVYDEKLFNKLLLIVALTLSVSNIIYYFYFYDFLGRFQGTFGGANEFAYMMAFLIYIIYYNFYKYPEIKFKFLFIVALIILHLLILITLSRTAILGLFIFYFFSSPYFYRKIKFWQKIIILVLLVLMGFYMYDTFSKSFELLIDRFTNQEGSNSLGSRWYEIMAGINMIKDHPLSIIFGNGTSISGSMIFPNYYAGLNGGLGTRIHNAYFALIAENGIVSFIIFIYFIIFLMKKLLRLKNMFKYVTFGFTIFTLSFLGTIYLFYFLPFWLALFLISAHTHLLDNEG